MIEIEMAGAPKQFDRDKVLEKALNVFWVNGYESTSMQDLVNGMGINRASMYDTFGNKRELFCEAFDRYCTIAINNIESILTAEVSPIERIKSYFKLITQPHGEGNFGCFVNNVAVEFGPHDADIARKVLQFWDHIELQLTETLEQAIKRGELKNDVNCRTLAGLINTTAQGMAAMSKAGISQVHTEHVYEQLLALLPAP